MHFYLSLNHRMSNITQIVNIHRTFVSPSQSINYGTATSVGDQRPRIVFRVAKIGSHLAGRLSEIRLTLSAKFVGGEGAVARSGIVAQSLLNAVSQVNLYVGQTKLLGYNDAHMYLQARERTENHPSLFHDTCAYYYGFNEKEKTALYAKADGEGFLAGFSNYRDDTNPFFRIQDVSGVGSGGNQYTMNNSFDLAIPLTTISDFFQVDGVPLHLLDKQDIMIELFLDLTNVGFAIRQGDTGDHNYSSELSLLNAELYQVSYSQVPEVLAKEREMVIPMTNVQEAISTAGTGVLNFQFSLARQRLKRLIIHRSDISSPEPYLGRAASSFVDSLGQSLLMNCRYNGKLYWPEDVATDTKMFSYLNDCSWYGQAVVPAGLYDAASDASLLSSSIVPIGNNLALQTVAGRLNIVMLPFYLIEQNSSLASMIEHSGEMIDDKPILITLRPQGAGVVSASPLKLHCHSETQRLVSIKPNDVMLLTA